MLEAITGAAELVSPQNDTRIHWTAPYTFFTTLDPGITVSTPVLGQDGTLRVLGIDVLLKDISNFTRSIRPTPGTMTPRARRHSSGADGTTKSAPSAVSALRTEVRFPAP